MEWKTLFSSGKVTLDEPNALKYFQIHVIDYRCKYEHTFPIEKHWNVFQNEHKKQEFALLSKMILYVFDPRSTALDFLIVDTTGSLSGISHLHTALTG